MNEIAERLGYNSKMGGRYATEREDFPAAFDVLPNGYLVWLADDVEAWIQTRPASQKMGKLVAGILTWLRDQPGPARTRDLYAAFPGHPTTTLNKTVHRMVRRGLVVHPRHGLVAAAETGRRDPRLQASRQTDGHGSTTGGTERHETGRSR